MKFADLAVGKCFTLPGKRRVWKKIAETAAEFRPAGGGVTLWHTDSFMEVVWVRAKEKK